MPNPNLHSNQVLITESCSFLMSPTQPQTISALIQVVQVLLNTLHCLPLSIETVPWHVKIPLVRTFKATQSPHVTPADTFFMSVSISPLTSSWFSKIIRETSLNCWECLETSMVGTRCKHLHSQTLFSFLLSLQSLMAVHNLCSFSFTSDHPIYLATSCMVGDNHSLPFGHDLKIRPK